MRCIIRETGARQDFRAGRLLGEGQEGLVHEVETYAGCAAKLYRHDGRNGARRGKVEAMMKRPPGKLAVKVEGVPLPLLAWPTHVVEDDDGRFAGFLMPMLDAQQSVSLVAYMSEARNPALSDNDRSLPLRLLLCRNIAGVLADLHRQGHHVIDLKPQNIRVFRETSIPCFLDTDSFSIAAEGGGYFGGTAYTPEYASPEVLREGRCVPDMAEHQDRFALALLLFQVLNRGIHPFQGVLVAETDDGHSTNEAGIREGRYAYGRQPHAAIRPSPGSIHESLPDALRELFDLAFEPGPPDRRPSAQAWRDRLDALRTASPPLLVRCPQSPSDVLHIHFVGYPCAACRRASQPQPHPGPGPSVPQQSPDRGLSVPTPRRWARRMKFALGAAIAGGAAWFLVQQLDLSPAVRASSAEVASPRIGAVGPSDEPRLDEALRRVETTTSTRRKGIDAVLRAATAPSDDVANQARQLRAPDTAAAPLADWPRSPSAARGLNDKALRVFEQDLPRALALQGEAFVADPASREVAGNLGMFLAMAGHGDGAMALAVYALLLPRGTANPVRVADWQLLAMAHALAGDDDAAVRAYTVALSLSTRPEGFCASLLKQAHWLGERLHPAVTKAFQVVADTRSDAALNCTAPAP